jgi:hypothetical protein
MTVLGKTFFFTALRSRDARTQFFNLSEFQILRPSDKKIQILVSEVGQITAYWTVPHRNVPFRAKDASSW